MKNLELITLLCVAGILFHTTGRVSYELHAHHATGHAIVAGIFGAFALLLVVMAYMTCSIVRFIRLHRIKKCGR